MISAQCVYPAATADPQLWTGTDAGRKKILDDINDFRAKTATAFKISNMHEISYDVDLEREAQASKCVRTPSGPFMVLRLTPSPAVQAKINSTTPENQEEIWQEILKDHALIALGPEQTRIGCAEHKRQCDLGVCLIGPQTSVSDSDFTKGEPGSNCPNGKASSGLCKASENNTKKPDADVKQQGVDVEQKEGNSSTGFVFSTVSIIVSVVFYNFF
ncbi:hypothetical protein CRE_21754 [Caenorhabditis remanei]|uniref:SCP domain-containing protein n=1 Tax=Caenorhabditis remanei TaxID=31234 RepID=E3MEN1_CAERE|nr:hypothetical protein CRE_21754 [Caenorhabditis remanei]